MKVVYDASIVGGGPAGLSAALILAFAINRQLQDEEGLSVARMPR